MPAKPIPPGTHTVTPHLVIKGAAEALEFYKKAFGAQVIGVHYGPDGKSIMHAQIKIGDSPVYLADEFPGGGCRSPRSLGGSAVMLNLYVEDCDTVFNRAVAAGAKVTMPLADQFWGDRWGALEDPYGHAWSIATHKEDLTPQQLQERAKEAFAAMAK